MPDYPFTLSGSPCELEMALIILREAERESMEIFYAMREKLRFYLKRTQLLETILTEKGIPKYDDCSLTLPGWQSLLLADSSGFVPVYAILKLGAEPLNWLVKIEA